MTRRGILSVLPLLLPQALRAKGDTVRISIAGPGLAAPVEITEGVGLFQVWSGPGTSSREPQSFLADWAAGAVEPPESKLTYQITVHTTRPAPHSIYFVLYRIDSSGKGYVYIPGKDHPAYTDNTWLILRSVEGKWFRAWKEWEAIAHPLIAKASAR